MVAKGYSQKGGVDFNKIFCYVMGHTSIRVLHAMVTHQDLKLEQLDVKTAFRHREVEEDILMSQPKEFAVRRKEDHVCRL